MVELGICVSSLLVRKAVVGNSLVKRQQVKPFCCDCIKLIALSMEYSFPWHQSTITHNSCQIMKETLGMKGDVFQEVIILLSVGYHDQLATT